jgi:hypothetical protein
MIICYHFVPSFPSCLSIINCFIGYCLNVSKDQFGSALPSTPSWEQWPQNLMYMGCSCHAIDENFSFLSTHYMNFCELPNFIGSNINMEVSEKLCCPLFLTF